MDKLIGKKRLINTIELVVQVLFLLSAFIFQTVSITSHSYNSTSVSKMSLFLYTLLETNTFGYVAFFFMFINAIICLVSIFGNSQDKDGKLHVAIPIIGLFFGFLLLSANTSTLSINPLYKIFGILCLISIVVMSIIKRSSLVVPKTEPQPQQIINNIQETSNADELKKFKDLLDSGIITQEEFDEKKKQLLGL